MPYGKEHYKQKITSNERGESQQKQSNKKPNPK